MILARVAGTVVGAKVDERLAGRRFILVEDADHHGRGRGDYVVALDAVGAERGQLVLLSQGSSCHWSKETADRPVDALAVAIVESVDELGRLTYGASGQEVRHGND